MARFFVGLAGTDVRVWYLDNSRASHVPKLHRYAILHGVYRLLGLISWH